MKSTTTYHNVRTLYLRKWNPENLPDLLKRLLHIAMYMKPWISCQQCGRNATTTARHVAMPVAPIKRVIV